MQTVRSTQVENKDQNQLVSLSAARTLCISLFTLGGKLFIFDNDHIFVCSPQHRCKSHTKGVFEGSLNSLRESYFTRELRWGSPKSRVS